MVVTETNFIQGVSIMSVIEKSPACSPFPFFFFLKEMNDAVAKKRDLESIL